MKGVEFFLDTNILVYLSDSDAITKSERASALVHEGITTGGAAISTQVMQECLHVMSLKKKIPDDVVRACLVNVLLPLCRLSTTPELIETALDLRDKTRYTLYDSLVIASALACNAKTLYSEDLQHGQRIKNLTIVNPFE